MDSVERLRRQLDEYAVAGHASRLGRDGHVRALVSSVHAVVRTDWREDEHWVNLCSVAAMPLLCGEERGVMAMLACGNYKDGRSCVAAGQACASALAAFEKTLLSRADIGPAIRRAVLDAHDAIVGLSEVATSDPQLARFLHNDPRGGKLTGIGAETAILVALSDALYATWVGDVQLLLLRGGRLRQLNLPHTLMNEARGRMPPEQIEEHFRFCVTRVLGFAETPPQFDVTRLELYPGDRVIFGTCDLTDVIPAISATSQNLDVPVEELVSVVVHNITNLKPRVAYPATVGVIQQGSGRQQ